MIVIFDFFGLLCPHRALCKSKCHEHIVKSINMIENNVQFCYNLFFKKKKMFSYKFTAVLFKKVHSCKPAI